MLTIIYCYTATMLVVRPKKILVLPVGVAKNLGKGGMFFLFLFFIFVRPSKC